jgi:regulator of protease activity HflC (stomatin/prohibitin superfamily)
MPELTLCLFGIIAVTIIIFLAAAMRIVPEDKRLSVFRLGRHIGKKGPGMVFLIPLLDRAIEIDLANDKEELDTVVLTRDITEHGLKQGDIGAVVHVYQDSAAFEVEFVTGKGRTVAVLTLQPEEIRPIHNQEILHVRQFAPG